MNGKIIIVAVAVLAVSIAAAFIFLRTAPTPTIRFDPEQTQAAMGQDFDVNITISDVRDLFGWEIKMRWNTTLLEVLNVTEGGFLKSRNLTLFFPQVNNTAGYVLADCTYVSDPTGVDGQGVLATVTFRTKAAGSGSFDLYETMLMDSAEHEIAHTALDGQFTGTGPDE